MSTTMEGVRVGHETDVLAKAQRRRFTAAEKLRVPREADCCTKSGEVSALLRREGLYSSHLSTWREARRRGELAGLAAATSFPWYNTEHHHVGLGLCTPHDVHFGLVAVKGKQRARVLAEAFARHPERFPNGRPSPRPLPTAVWINPPKTRSDGEEVVTTLTRE